MALPRQQIAPVLAIAMRLMLAAGALLVAPSVTYAQSETVEYYGLDALGSVRTIFDQQGNVVARMDYGPFGENLRASIKFPTQQFAQLMRDAESGQDYAQARNYSAGNGRFNRVDPIYAGLFEPQRWNRYAYAVNGPLVLIDASGLNACPDDPEFGPIDDCVQVYAEDPWKSFLLSLLANRFGGGSFAGGGTSGAADDGGGTITVPELEAVRRQYCATNYSRCDANGQIPVSMAGIPNGAVAAGTAAVLTLTRVGQQGSNVIRNVQVYIGKIDGRAVYVGITNNIPRRIVEHAGRFAIQPITNALTRLEARAIEQALIEQNPDFLNKINSISPLNPIYTQATQWGINYLKALGLW